MIELALGDLALTLDPAAGGCIAAFTWRGAALLRPVVDPRLAAQRGKPVAAYPLIPYANRIAWGRFSWEGVTHQLARNFGDHPHTIHGNAWMRPWSVIDRSATRARLALDHTPPRDQAAEWPFAYHAEQAFTLAPDRLQIALSLRNCDRLAWPAGMGLHPYVARTPGTRLRFHARGVWTTGADSLPDRQVAIAGAQDFSTARAIGADEIDACYAGWNGAAEVSGAGAPSLELHADAVLGHLQLYTPAGRDFFGLEPVANMPDAINRFGLSEPKGLRLLQPGETLSATVEFRVLT